MTLKRRENKPMKKMFNDKKLYLYFGLAVSGITLILAIISFYSILYVQPSVKKLLAEKDKTRISASYKKAYIMLRDPQLFALYENFDTDLHLSNKFEIAKKRKLESKAALHKQYANSYSGSVVKNQLIRFDKMIYSGIELTADQKIYLEALLDRRIKGAQLGRNTMFYCLIITILTFAFYFYEKRSMANKNV